ncbi:NADH-ubiquinone oxidoreductase B12 subunit family-domain-containing protein [Phakopsora pachyrhizi]|uniref:NADH-ubiquinone oxidoreductase B12 subunit family-domain-containing protein n=1 Tax=Phakopsora pachyrhizi TaxID=170000 RepID=A0AAV0BSR7_PHAPC|nr:NADH-ubiquinone oxidoreductase B12 subunit family-domain-containing protein [Phakopsora pachyrhizi]CAH7689349.1 NADH-ubiquinone oxidoreductase B12 subunit family-domain-containing protein [Phakopsora pachyrhizi]
MVLPRNTYRDPWAKNEAWRNHPIFSRRQQLRNFFPGFGWASVAFTIYVLYDNNYRAKNKNIEDVKGDFNKIVDDVKNLKF